MFTPTETPRTVDLPSGLVGRTEEYTATIAGRVARRELCVVVAGPYTYVMRLDSFSPARWGEDRVTLAALLASARPVPVARPAAAGAAALSHWVD